MFCFFWDITKNVVNDASFGPGTKLQQSDNRRFFRVPAPRQDQIVIGCGLSMAVEELIPNNNTCRRFLILKSDTHRSNCTCWRSICRQNGNYSVKDFSSYFAIIRLSGMFFYCSMRPTKLIWRKK